MAQMRGMNEKTKVASLSIFSNSLLIALKVTAGVMSGSVSIISEAIHSGMDLVAAVIAFLSVRFSSKPADKSHPYGHGKIENISGIIEGLLILIAAGLIIMEAIKKILHPGVIHETTIAIIVMGISAIVNSYVSKILYRTARKEDSMALEADALHLKTDVYTSIGVGLGLLLITFTGLNILDPIVAILVALLIIKESIHLIWQGYCQLLDAKLSDVEEDRIRGIISQYNGQIIDFHMLRTRKSGNLKYIDFHMTVNKDLTVEQSHNLGSLIESDLEVVIRNTNVNIHIEPGPVIDVAREN